MTKNSPKKYKVWFQDSYLMIITANNNNEARQEFNKNISIKEAEK